MTRSLVLALVATAIGGFPQTSVAGPIYDFVGGLKTFSSPYSAPSGFEIRGVERVGTGLYAYGWAQGSPSVLSFDIVGENLANPTYTVLPTIAGYNGFAPGGGIVTGVSMFGGQLTFSGYSNSRYGALQDLNSEATIWRGGIPTGLGGGLTSSSDIHAASPSGVLVGRNESGAKVFTETSSVTLPRVGNAAETAAGSVTDDGQYIAGWDGPVQVYWTATGDLLNPYARMTPLQPYFNATGLGAFDSLAQDALGNPYGFMFFEDPFTGDTKTGIWDLIAGGDPLQTWDGSLVDAKLYGDTIVVGLNTMDGGMLGTFGWSDVMRVNQLPGMDTLGYNPTLPTGALWEGSFGIFANGQNGMVFATHYDINPASSAVPEPSPLILAFFGLLGLLSKRIRFAPNR